MTEIATVNNEAQAFLESVREMPPMDTQTVGDNRTGLAQALVLTGPATPVHEVFDTAVTDVPVRVYRPTSAPATAAIVFLHGGGWVLGDLELADTTCRDLAVHSGASVVSVDYRLAPEHRFPAAFEDALAVTRALLDEASGLAVDPTRVAVAGDSAGGNLAAATALALRQHPRGLRHQALIYPVTHVRVGTTPSYRAFTDGHFLRTRDMQWFVDHYAPEADPTDPRVAPLEVSDLRGAASATVVLAECDPLHDDGTRYTERLREANVPVEAHLYHGQVHPFVYVAGVCPGDANDARRRLGIALGAALA